MTINRGEWGMLLRYENLDGPTRSFMVEEIDRDVAAGTLYLSAWLTDTGRTLWPQLLRDAASSHDDEWLADQLRGRGLIKASTQVRTPSGGMATRRVPAEGPEIMVHEFNIFYVRAVCRRAVEAGGAHPTVYRAKEVDNPRPESVRLIGTTIDPAATLADLRETHGKPPRLGFPAGPNTGLTIRL
jgi:hypothetical protein